MPKDVNDQRRRRPPRKGGRPPPGKGGKRPPRGSDGRRPRRPRGPPDGKKRDGERRGRPPKEKGEDDKGFEFDRFEIEVGSPRVSGVEKREEEKPAPKEEKGGRRGVEEVRISMDPKAEARISYMEKELGKIDEKVTENVETLVSMVTDLQEIKEGHARMDILLRELEETRDSYVKVDKTMREMAALYDLISAQINPFIDMEGHTSEATGARWDGIEDNVELLRQNVGGSPVPLGGDETTPMKEMTPLDRSRNPRGSPASNQFKFEAFVLKWVQFLTSKIRQEDIPNLLRYYREIGWINEEIEITTMNFLTGAKSEPNLDVAEGDIYISEDGTVIGQTDGWKLSIEDHAKSLEYVEDILKYFSPKKE